MTGRLEGKVAFITGAARGQGRAHALRMAREGADIIAVDLCAQIPSVSYRMSTPEDLAETERAVKELGRRIATRHADVRDRSELSEALQSGIAELGRLDVVVANAGIFPYAPAGHLDAADFVDATDVDLLGVMNTVAVSVPHIADHGSIIVTGSTAAMMMRRPSADLGSGGDGYGWSKRTIVEYTEHLAIHLAPRFIRVNAIHPSNCDTDMIQNEGLYSIFRPDLEHPTLDDVQPLLTQMQAMPIPYVQPEDVANLALFLASDESRYITGQQIRVDAGAVIKSPDGPQR